MAYLSPPLSASRTIPYVPAPNVRPNRYCPLDYLISMCRLRTAEVDKLLIVAVWLTGQLVHHVGDYCGKEWSA